MKAAIIAIGSEMLGTTRLDTNSLKITRMLEAYGIPVRRKAVVGDDRALIASELKFALADHELVVLSGGLGPTEDDLTKEAVAAALGLELQFDESILERIRRLFAMRNLQMPEVNRKQAMVFPGHRTLHNQLGSAPAFQLNVAFDDRPRHIWIFPGVPRELEALLEHDFEAWLRETRRGGSIHRRAVKISGSSESQVEEELAPFYGRHRGEPVTILASQAEIQIHFQAEGSADEAYPRLTAMEQELRAIFGDRIFGLDDEKMEEVVGRLLAQRGETVATAESCTGGLLASRITDVSGSSAYFMGGVVTYSRDAKLFMLGVDPALVDAHGEVSEEVARDMARGARRRFGTTYGIGITGIAGPTGGTEAKPVGTVHVAVASAQAIDHRRLQLIGNREMVKFRATQAALDFLRLMMMRGK
ncbi:MAG: competence/damage-inducible protein A [Thermoanaerobaculia bacterium]